MSFILSIDPGSKKCGLVLADVQKRTILNGKVVKKDSVIDLVMSWRERKPFEEILLGDGTSSELWQANLNKVGLGPVCLVNEERSTLRARERYWELWPPSWYLRWIPKGMLLPQCDLDAIAALIFLENYYGEKFKWNGEVNFKIWP